MQAVFTFLISDTLKMSRVGMVVPGAARLTPVSSSSMTTQPSTAIQNSARSPGSAESIHTHAMRLVTDVILPDSKRVVLVSWHRRSEAQRGAGRDFYAGHMVGLEDARSMAMLLPEVVEGTKWGNRT